MKALKPSMKEKKRYLLLESKLKGKSIRENVEKAILDFIGVSGMSKCGLSWIKDRKNVLCVNRKMVDSIRASLCVWPERIDVIRVSGTLKGLERNK
ncbi:hypothetical protein GF378_01355 [Candidatus Pacearchaeota archaeon]|nr:hypothetical protein [Candidatus Pacearchaeota archaeon]